MTAIAECEELDRLVDDYIAHRLPGEESLAVEHHLTACQACRTKVKRFRQVAALLQDTFDPTEPLNADLHVKANQWINAVTPEELVNYAENCHGPARPTSLSRMQEWLFTAPWWFVSVALHALIFALASLVSMAIELPVSG